MVLDTNVLVSALITPGGLPDQLLQRWEAGELTLVTSNEQLDEIQRVLGYEKLSRFIRADQAARLMANLRQATDVATALPTVSASDDPSDNLIIATAIAGNANHLVTGDRGHLLSLKAVESVSIVTVREALDFIADSGSTPD
jgi:putative PIN family toxin of toxin-antitoxin system